MARLGERAHRLEAAGVGVEHVCDGSTQVCRQHEGGRGAGRAQVRDAVGEGVVEIQHVARGASERDLRQEILAGGPHGASRALLCTGVGAGEPVQESERIRGPHSRQMPVR